MFHKIFLVVASVLTSATSVAAAQPQTPADNGVPGELDAYQMQELCSHDAAAFFKEWKKVAVKQPGLITAQTDYEDDLTSRGCFILAQVDFSYAAGQKDQFEEL